MFAGKSIIQVMFMGGFVIYILIFFSVLALAVIGERLVHFRKISRIKRAQFLLKLTEILENEGLESAKAYCEKTRSVCAKVANTGLSLAGKSKNRIENAMDRRISHEVTELEKHTSILGSIGSTVVYVGLFGTVIGIIRAFQDIALTANGAGGGMGMVITGIAEALVSTAAGILVAVPSVIAYNMIMNKIGNFTSDMEITASEVSDLLTEK